MTREGCWEVSQRRSLRRKLFRRGPRQHQLRELSRASYDSQPHSRARGCGTQLIAASWIPLLRLPLAGPKNTGTGGTTSLTKVNPLLLLRRRLECFGLLPQLFFYLGIWPGRVCNFIEERQRLSFLALLHADPRELQEGEVPVPVRGELEIMLPGDLRLFPIGVRHPIKRFRVSASVFKVSRCEPARFAKLEQGALQQFRRIDLPGRSQIMAEDEFDVPEVEMIIGIVTIGANRQKKLLRRFGDAAHPEVRAAQRVGRFPILRVEPLRRPPMFDACCRIPVFPEKCGSGVLRRDRPRIVPDQLVVDLLHPQTLFCRYIGIRERLRCLMGLFDFYPRFYRRTDELRTREHKRKEQNKERGGGPLASTPIAPPAAADYHSCPIDYTTKQQKKTKDAANRAYVGQLEGRALSHPSWDVIPPTPVRFDEFAADQWDRQIEANIIAGHLDAAGKRADEDFEAGRCTPV